MDLPLQTIPIAEARAIPLMDDYTVPAVGISRTFLGVLGSLYLAYCSDDADSHHPGQFAEAYSLPQGWTAVKVCRTLPDPKPSFLSLPSARTSPPEYGSTLFHIVQIK